MFWALLWAALALGSGKMVGSVTPNVHFTPSALGADQGRQDGDSFPHLPKKVLGSSANSFFQAVLSQFAPGAHPGHQVHLEVRAAAAAFRPLPWELSTALSKAINSPGWDQLQCSFPWQGEPMASPQQPYQPRGIGSEEGK